MAFQLLALTDPGCPGSIHYRLEQYRTCFQQLRIDLRIEQWPGEQARQAMLLAEARNADAVLFQRFLPKARLIRRFRENSKRLIYDFDDAVIYTESSYRKPRLRPQRWLRFVVMVRSCDQVTAGNSYLADLARRWASRQVRVVPTTVEAERYDGEAPARDRPPVLGWIGGHWTAPYLERLRRPLEVLSKEDGLVVRVIADRPAALGSVPSQWVDWKRATEVHELKRLSIGLAPLPDDRWTRGKCGLRLLQYLAAGVPGIASPVGVQADLTGEGAALAAVQPIDWVTAVRRLLADQILAGAIIRRGRALARCGFSARRWGPEVARSWCGEGLPAR